VVTWHVPNREWAAPVCRARARTRTYCRARTRTCRVPHGQAEIRLRLTATGETNEPRQPRTAVGCTHVGRARRHWRPGRQPTLSTTRCSTATTWRSPARSTSPAPNTLDRTLRNHMRPATRSLTVDLSHVTHLASAGVQVLAQGRYAGATATAPRSPSTPGQAARPTTSSRSPVSRTPAAPTESPIRPAPTDTTPFSQRPPPAKIRALPRRAQPRLNASRTRSTIPASGPASRFPGGVSGADGWGRVGAIALVLRTLSPSSRNCSSVH
jgi:hypothetical protein